MVRAINLTVTLLILAAPVVAGAQSKRKPVSPAREYQALLDAYEKTGGPRGFADKFFRFAKAHPKNPAAVDALAWVVKNLQDQPEAARAIALLQSDHLKSPRLADACRPVSKSLTPAAGRLLQAALRSSPHAKVRAQACFHLVTHLDEQLRIADQIKRQPAIRKRAEQYYGKQVIDYLASLDEGKVIQQKERLYEKMLKSFANVPAAEATMGELAKKNLFAMRHLAVGKRAPDIEGEDIDGQTFKLSDYRGKIVMVSFWGDW